MEVRVKSANFGIKCVVAFILFIQVLVLRANATHQMAVQIGISTSCLLFFHLLALFAYPGVGIIFNFDEEEVFEVFHHGVWKSEGADVEVLVTNDKKLTTHSSSTTKKRETLEKNSNGKMQ